MTIYICPYAKLLSVWLLNRSPIFFVFVFKQRENEQEWHALVSITLVCQAPGATALYRQSMGIDPP